MEDGYERHYLKIVSFKNEEKRGNGFVCFNVDYTAPLMHRVFIRHISTIKGKQLEQALLVTIEYIWKNVQCDNIRFELFHIKDLKSGALKADLNFKESL